ncbi:hypothetical protein C3942_12180 [Solimonas fluminis]|uniref:Uncharacterized protein n=1 Tax=Solimonas fluminis TaxID=2086571 RepID=A0A2S5TF01_9GAMM|nr:hypothetical protein [Solimonas fluminis]PPE73555.1 hypothetical protein C3942_12180 [Solimonas fluminis]
MDQDLEHIAALLERFLDEDDRAALEAACTAAAARRSDIDAPLRWLQSRRAPAGRKDLATRRLRAALRLPAMPGPPCRPDPY